MATNTDRYRTARDRVFAEARTGDAAGGVDVEHKQEQMAHPLHRVLS